ncbi:MAG: PspA/IM30 family protein [Chloroflexi bacterium]|nr:PspA/IM30 family protein [Chloroflexota bacterium]
MGLLSRMATVIKAKVSELLGHVEDPHQMLDYSYEKQLELLQQVKRGIVEVVTSRRRLELQAGKQRENVAKLEEQARRALAAGREDLTRVALERKQVALGQLQDLETQIAGLEQEHQRLTQAESRLAAKVESFRTHKEVVKARYSAAEAQVRIGEAVTGLSEEFADVTMAVQRAEEKTEHLQARAAAIDELVAEGSLEDFTGRTDVIEQELQHTALKQNVDAELEAMKRQLQGPGQPKALGDGR